MLREDTCNETLRHAIAALNISAIAVNPSAVPDADVRRASNGRDQSVFGNRPHDAVHARANESVNIDATSGRLSMSSCGTENAIRRQSAEIARSTGPTYLDMRVPGHKKNNKELLTVQP